MKKRILSLLLVLIMCFTLFTPQAVKAAETSQTASLEDSKVNTWAIPDLVIGDTYGIYPLTWYEQGVTGAIKKGQFLVLLAGLRNKIIETDSATEIRKVSPSVDSKITVEEAIKALYTMISNYDYTADLGLGYDLTPVKYMELIGVYTGRGGEQKLQERCSIEQALVMATRLTTILYEALDASSKGFLWEVKNDENTVYMMGSIHVASNEIYPFSDKIWQAYNASETLVLEADIYNEEALQEMTVLAFYDDGTSLKDHVSAECYQKVVETAALFGIPEETAAAIRPWYLNSVFESYALTGSVDSDKIVADLGIDVTLITQAYLYSKPVAEIEGLAAQAKMLAGFSDGLQELMLLENIEAINNMMNGTEDSSELSQNEQAAQMLEYWHDGDVEAFTEFGYQDDFGNEEDTDQNKAYIAEYTDKLLTKRNVVMAEYINKLLKEKGSHTSFVVVGAAHFTSEANILDLLKAKGYMITQIK
ncbi:MAG: TraB/GumN family protein [Mobilitalea sp.]